LLQLTTVKNTLLLVLEVWRRGEEMRRRMKFQPRERASEEKKLCTLYNDLFKYLPPEIQIKAPEPLKTKSFLGLHISGGLYPQNLQAVVKLV
ncbi:hypothetical protein C8A01DRAFT_40609, partial [Parachaetomium inaequale]